MSNFLSFSRAYGFQVFKIILYAALLSTTLFFLLEDLGASAHTFRDGLNLANIKDALATFIDSCAWFILLMMFELQTYVISDRVLRGKTKWLLNGISAVCYLFILLALSGYWERAITFYEFDPTDVTDACALVGNVQSYIIKLDDYADLTQETCHHAGTAPLVINTHISMITSVESLSDLRRIAMTDVLNATAWILVVLILWADVWLQIGGRLSDRLFRINAYMKGALYIVLVVAAIYWVWFEEWIDALDAILWLLAFFVIELNLFNWHEETQDTHQSVKG